MLAKSIVAGALALAVAVTFGTGAHRHLFSQPLKRTALDRPLPTVTPNAIEQGCAAWGEALSSCLTEPDRTDFPFGDATRM